MNSSGIKRGLATTAVSALAVAGIPFIASSASASATALTVANVGPVRDGNAAGGTVVFSVPEGTTVNDAQVKLIRSDLTGVAGNQNTPSQTVAKVGTVSATPEGDEAYGSKTATDEFSAQISVDTNPTGATAEFAVFIDANNNNAVDAAELRTPVSITTSGAPASVAIAPDSHTTAAGVASPEYTVTVKDSTGKLTQLVTGEGFAITGTGGATATPAALTPAELADGTEAFTATAATGGTKTLTVAGTGTVASTVADTASLVVLDQAVIDADEFDLVTGADDFESGDAFGGNYAVRVDQGAVTFKFMSKDTSTPADGPDDAGRVVLLTLTGAGNVKFDGETTKTYSVVLDDQGMGSLTVNPTGVVAGSSFTFYSDSFGAAPATTVTFERAAADSVDTDKDVYVSKIGSSTAVTVKVLDQFGDPIGAPAQVSITRDARNGGTTTARVTVDANGEATFNLPDAGTTAGDEDLDVNLYDDQFDGTPTTSTDVATISYTADGLGADFGVTTLTANAADNKIIPLYDSNAGAGDSVTETITGATAGTPATISVDNGALILLGAETNLTQGSDSETITLTGGTGSFKVVGTKLGVVNVTIENAGRTKTYKLTVTREGMSATEVAATARNVELDGPTEVVAGDVATYAATVTDAFENTVPGVNGDNLGFTVSGPGNLQNKETATDADGELEQTVLLTDNANSSITVKVTGTGAQFGKAANSRVVANDAPGLSASDNTDSITAEVVNIAQLEQAVEEAEAALEEAQTELAIAQGNLDVAEAELAVAQGNVDSLTAKKQSLRKKLNRAKANDNKKKAKTTRKKLRAVKRNLRAAQDNLTVASTKVDAAQRIVDLREAKVAQAEEDLAEAQQNLEDAQNN